MTPRKPMRQKRCESCDSWFVIANTLAKYCSRACGQRAFLRERPGYMAKAQRRYLAASSPERAERRRQYMAEYRARPESKKRAKELVMSRYYANPAPRKAYVRARREGYKLGHTPEQWQDLISAYRSRCAYCGRKRPLTKDHIVPISQGNPATVDRISNIVPACRSCNSRKHTGPPPQPVQIAL